jgi:hypothetical protein
MKIKQFSGGKTHYTEPQNIDKTTYRYRELYHLQFHSRGKTGYFGYPPGNFGAE